MMVFLSKKNDGKVRAAPAMVQSGKIQETTLVSVGFIK